MKNRFKYSKVNDMVRNDFANYALAAAGLITAGTVAVNFESFDNPEAFPILMIGIAAAICGAGSSYAVYNNYKNNVSIDEEINIEDYTSRGK